MPGDIVLEVSPRVAALITEAKINVLSNNTDVMENGYLGSVGGCKIYVSSQITPYLNAVDIWTHDCIMRTKRAVAFAEQISEIEASALSSVLPMQSRVCTCTDAQSFTPKRSFASSLPLMPTESRYNRDV